MVLFVRIQLQCWVGYGIISKVFRGKYLEELKNLWNDSRLKFHGTQSVINYLRKYTHRIAISNHRIKSMTETTVTYAVKDYKNKGH